MQASKLTMPPCPRARLYVHAAITATSRTRYYSPNGRDGRVSFDGGHWEAIYAQNMLVKSTSPIQYVPNAQRQVSA